MELFIKDTQTQECWGPYSHDGALWADYEVMQLKYAQLFEKTEGKQGMLPRAFAFRFYTVMSAPQGASQFASDDYRQVDKVHALGIRFDASKYKGMSWETLSAKCEAGSPKHAAIDMVADYALKGTSNSKVSIVLWGDNGTGKTGLMVLLAAACKRPYIIAEFRTVIDAIQASYGMKNRDAHDIVQAFRKVPVLFLDDMGDPDHEGRASDDQRDKTYQIIEGRHKADLPTVITTNLSDDRLRKQFGLRIVQRLQEMAAWVEVAGETLR